jgi:hypothetical protein
MASVAEHLGEPGDLAALSLLCGAYLNRIDIYRRAQMMPFLLALRMASTRFLTRSFS